jgi:hypothetical protein
MHAQVVNVHLAGIDDAGFRALCDELASNFTAIPGMQAKIWLADPATNTYGGIYLWDDRAAMEKYARSDLFEAVASHPNFTDLTSHDFEVLTGPTALTSRGLLRESGREIETLATKASRVDPKPLFLELHAMLVRLDDREQSA